MPFLDTAIPDVKIFDPQVWLDERGYFYESYNENVFHAAGIFTKFVQDNQAKSSYGVLRGLHYQTGAMAQAKLVRVVLGKVLDVAVDIREDSDTYGKAICVELSDENHRQLFIPKGFAHGYVCLSETAIFSYKCDNFYSKAHEGGVKFNDPALDIDWKIDFSEAIVSEKDLILPNLGAHIRFY